MSLSFYLIIIVLISKQHVNADYELCQRNFCPPVPVLQFKVHIEPQVLQQLKIPKLLIVGNKNNGCLCRINEYIGAVCFGRNSCTSMPKSINITEKVLKVANTNIKQFIQGDFDHLSHLERLSIDGNYLLQSISANAFYNLNNLLNLSLAFNIQLSFLHRDAFNGLIKLRHLDLTNNAFENLYDISLTLTPQKLPELYSLYLDSNSFSQIKHDDFLPMYNSTLTELSLQLCRIEYINEYALLPLKHLKYINLGENNIKSSILTELLRNTFLNNIDIKVLKLFFMGFKKQPPTSLMEIVAQSNVTHLYLSRNQFQVLTKQSFPFMPKLLFLDLSETFIFQINDDVFRNLPNLRTLLLSGNRLSLIPKAVLSLKNLTYFDMQANSPPENMRIYFDLRNGQFLSMNNLLYLNLGHNGVAHLLNASFNGLQFLEILELKNCTIFHIENGTFIPLKNLKQLNLMDNYSLNENSIPEVFFPLINLEVLLLGNCRLQYVSKNRNPFENLKSLKYLGLENNQFKHLINIDFKPLVLLEEINLSFNQFTSWKQRMFYHNKNLRKVNFSKNKISDITFAMFEDFSNLFRVNLDQNMIQCHCSETFHSYKKWLRVSYSNKTYFNSTIFQPTVYCSYPNEFENVTLLQYLNQRQYGERNCSIKPIKIILLLTSTIILIFFGILIIVLFYYRWHIKYWIFLSKIYLHRKGKIIKNSKLKNYSGYNNYEYDAFVSYSNEDKDFIVKLVTMLENNNPHYRLCVYERDFQIGTIISESVLESVAKSRKTVLVISNHYAKSQWCRWESQICEHHRLFFANEHGEYVDNSLILIRLNSIKQDNLTPTLKYLLKTRIYLQWEETKQEIFWEKLRKALGPVLTVSEITRM